MVFVVHGGNHNIGRWTEDDCGLPAFEYKGQIPFIEYLENGDSVKLNPDPWFLLGNYQLTVFAHVSGQYELITGQRTWGRLNQGETPNSGCNHARLTVCTSGEKADKTYELVGMNSLSSSPSTSRRTFGCGYADYEYYADDVTVSRSMVVRPSDGINKGASAFLLKVSIHNGNDHAVEVDYEEGIRACYETMMQQRTEAQYRRVKYNVTLSSEGPVACGRFTAVSNDPALFGDRKDLSRYEGFPPVLFIKDISGKGKSGHDGRSLTMSYNMKIEPGATAEFAMIVGFSMEQKYSDIRLASKLLSDKSNYRKEWAEILPDYSDEADPELRRELVWHTYMLEAMATYSEYYNETKIPQGTIYDYDWGQHASARDNFQHALATIHYNPELTRSIIRYMMKRTRENGEIMLIEYGNGFSEHTCYQTSDQQLWFFLLISEYLKVTGDYRFLNEKVACYPVNDMPEFTIYEYICKCYDFLRNQVGTGSHGLVRLLNSDWCDAVYYAVDAPYNTVQPQGESHMNSAMACVILDGLADQLRRSKIDCQVICESMDLFKGEIFTAYMNDWGNRPYPRRMYFAGKAYGDDNMFLDHLGFTLMMPWLSNEQKSKLYEEMKNRLYLNEKLGAREQEKPELGGNDWEYGSRENGGFWYSLNGPAILGIATFDKAEAMKRMKQMSLSNASASFPEYWSSYWSAPDNIESSLMISEGLPDQTWRYADIPICCAHVHAWMIHCYHSIR